MLKKAFLGAVFAVALTSNAIAGSITVPTPGGETVTVSSAAVVASINSATGGAAGGVTSVVQTTPGGDITITTASGNTITVTSSFVGLLLSYY